MIKEMFVSPQKSIPAFVLLVAAVFVPILTSSNYLISVILKCFLFAGMGVSWNIIGGYGGKVSWCHSAFIAIGAYTGFIMLNKLGISPILSLPVGMFVSFIFATIMGGITLGFRGPFFAITTITFAELLKEMLLYFSGLTNGSSGMVIAYTEPDPWNMMFTNDKPYYYIALVLLIIAMFVSVYYMRSKQGYYLRTIRGDEDAAASLGVDTAKVKLRAFQLSAVMTSVIGTVYALFLTYIDPYAICSTDLAIQIGAIVVVGGVARLWGPVIGAFIVLPISELALMVFPGGGAMLFYGVVLVAVVVLLPGGLISIFDQPAVRRFFAEGGAE